MTKAQAGRLGGSVTAAQSDAKRTALRHLHASRRGVREHPEPPPELAWLIAATKRPGRDRLSARRAAAQLGIADTTLRRWERGIDRPAPAHHARIRRVAAMNGYRAPTKPTLGPANPK